MRTDLALDSLGQAIYARQREMQLIHHSDTMSHTDEVHLSSRLRVSR